MYVERRGRIFSERSFFDRASTMLGLNSGEAWGENNKKKCLKKQE